MQRGHAFPHVLADRSAWAKKRAHPLLQKKLFFICVYLRSFAEKSFFYMGANGTVCVKTPKSI